MEHILKNLKGLREKENKKNHIGKQTQLVRWIWKMTPKKDLNWGNRRKTK